MPGLPPGLDVTKVNAVYKEGVVQVTIPFVSLSEALPLKIKEENQSPSFSASAEVKTKCLPLPSVWTEEDDYEDFDLDCCLDD